MKKITTAVFLFIILFCVVFFTSPYWTLYQLKAAYEDKNAQMLTAHVDFPSVQHSVKTQLTTVLLKKAQTLTELPIMRLLHIHFDADTLVNDLVNQAVDNTLTTEGVTKIINSQASLKNLDNNSKLLIGLTAIAMDKVDIRELITVRSKDELNQKLISQLNRNINSNENNQDTEPSAHYCGINCFEVTTQIKGYPITAQMARKGLFNWQVVDIKLPVK